MSSTVERSYPLCREAVAALMREQGWTLQSLAKKAGIDRRTLGRIFEGGSLRMSSINALAGALDVRPTTLLDGNPNQPADGHSSQEEKKLCLRFSVEMDIPYSSFNEKSDVPQLLNDIGSRIKQLGLLIIESTAAGSVRILCLATRAEDVASFFAAFAEGKFADMGLKNPQILSDDDRSDDQDDQSADSTTQTVETTPEAFRRVQSHPEHPSSARGSANTAWESREKKPDRSVGEEPPTAGEVVEKKPSDLKTIVGGVAAGAALGSTIIPGIGTVIGGLLGGLFAKAMWRQRQDETEKPPR